MQGSQGLAQALSLSFGGGQELSDGAMFTFQAFEMALLTEDVNSS